MSNRKLLLVNKFYHDKGPAGGVGRYLVQEEEDLTVAGWDVIPFAMADTEARPTPWSRFFPRARDYSSARFSGGAGGDALSLIWNGEAATNLDSLIREARPDVAHLHNIYHHLSPSILAVLRRHRIPTVMTLHDLRLLCPAIHMLRDRKVCEKCKGGRLHNAVVYKCVKDSRAASLLAAAETFHQRTRGLYPKAVSRFLCPSRFIRDKYIEWGYPADKLQHLANFVDLGVWDPARLAAGRERDTMVYFGRISQEKGLRDLLEAQALWEQGHAAGRIAAPPLKLVIAGEGPCAGNLQARMSLLKLENAVYVGGLNLAGLQDILSRARFTVLPSVCYENGPMAALESLAAGVPLVGTDIGGIPELIQDGVNGVIVPPADPQGMLAGLLRANELDLSARRAARAWAEEFADRRAHMVQLEAILTNAIG